MGEKAHGASVPAPHSSLGLQGLAVSKPAAQPGILALSPSTLAPRFAPRQPRQAALMDDLHYLAHHCLNIYQTIMYLVARRGE